MRKILEKAEAQTLIFRDGLGIDSAWFLLFFFFFPVRLILCFLYAPTRHFSITTYLNLPGYHCSTCVWRGRALSFILFSWGERDLPSESQLIFGRSSKRSPFPPWGVSFQWLMVGKMGLSPASFPNWNVGFSELLKLLRYCVSLDMVQAVPSTLTALTEYFLSLISLDRWHAKPKLELLQDISLSAVSLVCPFICCARSRKVKSKKLY